MSKGLKEEIIKLRQSGLHYNEICEKLNCSKSTVSYHCRNNDIGGFEKFDSPSQQEIEEMQKFYDECGSSSKTAEKFRRNKRTVLKYITISKKEIMSPEEKKKSNVKAVVKYKRLMKLKAVEYKGGKCECCGYSKCVQALEFHHLNPNEKDFAIAIKTLPWEETKKELDKCIMVCANCHREIHYGDLKV